MKNNVMIPELEILTTEISKNRGKEGKGRKIAHIRFALDNYLAARERLERERSRKKTLWYRIGAWFRYNFTAQ